MTKDGIALRRTLQEFVRDHPDGWSHEEWERLLGDLRDRDVDVSDERWVGDTLERERLLVALERASVRGLGPKRREAIADRYGRLWDFRHAPPEEVAETARMPLPVAEETLRAVRA